MKLSVLFLICSLSMTYAAESYAQKTMISLEVRNETVGTVLEKLKKESGFDFFFNNKHVDLKRIVSVSMRPYRLHNKYLFGKRLG